MLLMRSWGEKPTVSTMVKIAIYVLEGLFAAGIIGSAIVIILTSIEDAEVFFSRGTPAREPDQVVEEQKHDS